VTTHLSTFAMIGGVTETPVQSRDCAPPPPLLYHAYVERGSASFFFFVAILFASWLVGLTGSVWDERSAYKYQAWLIGLERGAVAREFTIRSFFLGDLQYANLDNTPQRTAAEFVARSIIRAKTGLGPEELRSFEEECELRLLARTELQDFIGNAGIGRWLMFNKAMNPWCGMLTVNIRMRCLQQAMVSLAEFWGMCAITAMLYVGLEPSPDAKDRPECRGSTVLELGSSVDRTILIAFISCALSCLPRATKWVYEFHAPAFAAVNGVGIMGIAFNVFLATYLLASLSLTFIGILQFNEEDGDDFCWSVTISLAMTAFVLPTIFALPVVLLADEQLDQSSSIKEILKTNISDLAGPDEFEDAAAHHRQTMHALRYDRVKRMRVKQICAEFSKDTNLEVGKLEVDKHAFTKQERLERIQKRLKLSAAESAVSFQDGDPAEDKLQEAENQNHRMDEIQEAVIADGKVLESPDVAHGHNHHHQHQKEKSNKEKDQAPVETKQKHEPDLVLQAILDPDHDDLKEVDERMYLEEIGIGEFEKVEEARATTTQDQQGFFGAMASVFSGLFSKEVVEMPPDKEQSEQTEKMPEKTQAETVTQDSVLPAPYSEQAQDDLYLMMLQQAAGKLPERS